MSKRTVFPVLVAVSLLGLSGCEAIDLINSVGSILKPNASPTPTSGAIVLPPSSPTAGPIVVAPPASPTPAVVTASASSVRLEVVRSVDPVPVSLDWNLARQPNVSLSVSSELNPTYAKDRLLDGKLTTSWFSSEQDTPSQGRLPTVEIGFPQAVGVLSVNLRGDRERQKGQSIEELSLLITSSQGILLNETVKLPADAPDVNLVLRQPLDGATSLRLTVTRTRNSQPGLAEIEVLGRR